MRVINKVKKAISIFNNQGPIVFTKKSAGFFKRMTIHIINKVSLLLPERFRPNLTVLPEAYRVLANPVFMINEQDIDASKNAISDKKIDSIQTATWFVPYFDHLAFGGIQTIFRFIDYLARQGIENRIVIYDRPDLNTRVLKNEIVNAYPALHNANVVVFDSSQESIDNIPPTDIAFATKWESAYFLLKFNQTKRKYYFIQDYEPLFYEAGSTYALAESTYRFGFTGIVNTPGLLYAINQRHGLEGVSFVPAVDRGQYYPPKKKRSNKKTKIFFYARPNNPRNAFELGLIIIHQLIEKYGEENIEIITAGSKWDESLYGLQGRITNLGLLSSIEEVASLYRSCDIGFVFMLSKHPSYQPFEFMASGMATVTNMNEDNIWFLQNGYNCLIAEPSPAAMAEKIGWLIEDKKLRERIANEGTKIVGRDWDRELDNIWNYIKKG